MNVLTGFPGILVMAAAVSATAVAAPVTLVEKGTARCVIVVPAKPAPTVRFAAGELARYLEKISGAKVAVRAESAPPGGKVGGVRIDVGPTERVRSSGVLGNNDAPERICWRISPEGILICGGSSRGTLFAVYRFLEQVLGCRWLAPGIEAVPHTPTLRLDPGAAESTPVFDLRLFISRGSPERMDWGLKVGMNGFYTEEAAATNGNCLFLPLELPSCHTYSKVIPAKKYFGTHPEWFPLLGGKRTPTDMHGKQLCVTAPGLADEFARRIDEILDRHPKCRVTSISPNDGRGWCECPTCVALDKKLCGARTTRQGLGAERPFRGDRIFWFANEVAQRVARKHPNVLLLELAYINYAEPPDTIRPAANVVPWLCHYAPADYSRPIADPASEPNAQFNALLKRWTAITPDILIYAYVSKSMWWRLPRPVLRPFAADIKYYHKLGVHRYYAQSSLSDWQLDGPLYYVLAKLLWDPGQDPNVLAREWTQAMFGPAAPAMDRFYAEVDRAVRTTGRPYSDNPPRDVPGLYALEHRDKARQALNAALADAKADPTAEGRIAEIARVFDYGRWMIRAIEAGTRFRTSAEIVDLRQALDFGKKALSFVRVREAVRFLDGLKLTDAFGVPASGFGKTETKGGRTCWNTDETGPGDKRAGWALLYVPVPALTQPVKLVMDVWGASDLTSIVINTGGQGKSYADGGVWNPVKPRKPLSGKPGWETLEFIIPPALLAHERKTQRVGMGGGDSQIWIARVRIGPGPQVPPGDGKQTMKKGP